MNSDENVLLALDTISKKIDNLYETKKLLIKKKVNMKTLY